MACHLVVTVGTSAIYNELVGRDFGKAKYDSLRRLVESFRGSRHQLPKDNSQLFRELIDAHKGFWKAPKGKDRLKTSAELVSTEDTVKAIQPNDILLLSSDTDEGEFAAAVNGEVLKMRHPGLAVNVHRLKGLDTRFEGVFEELGEVIRRRYQDDLDTVAFDVTGGFKGTVLFVAAHALTKPWIVYYRHEDMGETLKVDLRSARVEVLSRRG